MHITHLETGRHVYGGARQVLLLLNGLAEQGIRTTLICPSDSAIATAVSHAKVTVHTLPLAGEQDLRFGRELGRYLADLSPDLLHVHSRRGAEIWGGLAARKANIPAVLTRRVDNPELPLLGRLKYGMFSRVIAISQQIRTQLVADGVGADRLDLIYSAIDADRLNPSWSRDEFLQAFGLTPDNRVVICVAQLIPRKGHATLLTAWKQVLEQQPQARLLLFGQGTAESELRKQVASSGLDETVQFAGFRADLNAFLGCADALVHPALKEGLGVVLLEAQAAGLPVVACAAGGIPEAVVADQSALLVAPGDADALASALTRLLDDPKLRAKLGAFGAQHVRENFSVARMVAANQDVYRRVLNEGRS